MENEPRSEPDRLREWRQSLEDDNTRLIDDIDALRAEVQQQPWEEDPVDPDILCRGVFLGTVMALTPSGKYYMPWACSNVETCWRCNGSGKLETRDRCELCEGTG